LLPIRAVVVSLNTFKSTTGESVHGLSGETNLVEGVDVKQVSDVIWEIPPSFKQGMNVPARIYATKKLLNEMDRGVFEQVTNVACLPGIIRYSYAMADAHWGYGFPIGGVAAFDLEKGVISPGGIGFDINCGMRLIRTNLRFPEVKPKVKELVDMMFQRVPTGVGVKGFLNVSQSQFEDIMRWGVKWCVENDLGWEDDVSHVEEGGYIKGAEPSKVSRQASSRGISQLGTLGSGNHYLEIQVVDPSRFFDSELAKKFGIIYDDQVMVMVHCGSRGFGHQIGTDYLRVFDSSMKRYNIAVRDRELACAPFSSKEGRDYYGAMVCAANMAFTNRQVIVNRIREVFGKVFHKDPEELDMHLIYDVCHNIAKVEKHSYDGTSIEVVVHRKGATRSFGPGHPDIPEPYREVGQPVIIGGSMETGSYLLVGTGRAMKETFGSTAHGSGRTMSRTSAKKSVRGYELQRSMEQRGIYVKAATMEGLAEEAGIAYKDISEVVETMDVAGISKKVAALRPIGNIKG
jgi:tRNA-splicing ligase RtcB